MTSVLVPILEDLFGWNSARIRALFESEGLAVQEWEKVQTDTITLCRTMPVVDTPEAVAN